MHHVQLGSKDDWSNTVTSFKLANVVIDGNRAFYATPRLYVNTTCSVIASEKPDSFTILGPGVADFTTFFNALSLTKWREYTVAERFSLHLELKGAACSVVQTRADCLDSSSQPAKDGRHELSASSEWRELDLPVIAEENDVLAGFLIEATGEVQLRNSYFWTEVDENSIRDIELAIATTTFRKEEFVTKNIALVRKGILSAGERASSHVTMHVVDNGRTLDAAALSGDGVFVHPNPNAGGAGGFARGMIEALDQEVPATNVLLMDDDVEVSAESILRTYNLLSLARDEWAEAFVSGAMMSSLQPDLRWEDLGFITSGGFHMSLKPKYLVSNFRDIIHNETIKPHEDNFPDVAQRYAAWWYCCIPATTIQREGLPLPLFVRYDDVEYSLRCKPRFMTMNGICIWHDEFTHRYNAAVERYQTMRNCLIVEATTNGAPLSDFVGGLRRNVFVELAKFNYADAELILDGFEDFLKGPGFFSTPGKAEETYMAANGRREQLLPYDELRELALKETGIDIADYNFDEIVRDIPLGLSPHGRPFNVMHTQLFERTINGQLHRSLKPFDGEAAAVIEHAGWAISYGRIYGKSTFIAIDPNTKRGAIRHMSKERCKQIWGRLSDDIKEYEKNKKEIEALYREARPLITSVPYWRKYLGLDGNAETR